MMLEVRIITTLMAAATLQCTKTEITIIIRTFKIQAIFKLNLKDSFHALKLMVNRRETGDAVPTRIHGKILSIVVMQVAIMLVIMNRLIRKIIRLLVNREIMHRFKKESRIRISMSGLKF